jgi:glyoxylase-like metal-dependent hydrolase (beta-lactamase superfamily II)
LHLADTVVHPIHLEQPEWYSIYDLEPELAVTTRQKLLDRVAAESVPVLSYHFPFPSVGHLSQKEKGWQWEPME